MKNFEFEHNGEKLWYSRSLAAVCAVYGYNTNKDLCVLVNKRGAGCEFNSGKWNLPAGFIDFDESAEEAAARELHEETGVSLDPTALQFVSLDTTPSGKRQTMSVLYIYRYDDSVNVDDIHTTNEFSEPNEVDEIKWVPIKDLNNYTWTRGQVDRIMVGVIKCQKLWL